MLEECKIEKNYNQEDSLQFLSQEVMGDKYILCHFHFRHGTIVEDSDNSLSLLLSRIPENFCGSDQKISVCEVSSWKPNNSGFVPFGVKILYQIHYCNTVIKDQ